MEILNEVNYFYYYMSLYELQIMNENDYYNGLSYNSILYLNVIEQVENCTISKLASMLGITKSGATLKVNELVKQGVVVKTQSEEDKRVFYLKLSPNMEKVFSIYDTVFEKIEKEIKKKYTEEQIEVFRDILHTISKYEWRKMKDERDIRTEN